MTDAEINVAIAEACGWRDIVFRGIQEPTERDYIGRHESCRPPGHTGVWSGPIPNYCADLNAIHAAEESLSRPEAFAARLGPILLRDGAATNTYGATAWHFAFAHATAKQRAEAFLRTVGKWKDPQ